MENEIFNETKISRAYIRLSLPLVFSMVVTLIYNLADTFFVAQTNDTNIVAGVSLGMPVFTLLMAIGNIACQFILLLCNNYYRHCDRSRYAYFPHSPLIPDWSQRRNLCPCIQLLYLSGGRAPVIMLSFIHSNLLRSEGMSKESMAGTILGALVNIVLDPIFISVLGWGASGAAIATVIGYLFSDVFFVIIVVRKSKVLSINPQKIKIPSNHIRQILGIGIPAAIVNLMQSASVVLMNQFLLPFGNEKIAAMGIVLKVNMIVLLLLTGFAYGGQPLFGYYYGSGDKKRLKELFHFCLRFISLTAIVLTAIVFLAAPFLMKCFMDNQSIIDDGTVMLRWQVITMVFVGIILLMTIIFQSMGKVVGSFILSISRQGVIFLAVLVIAFYTAGYMGIVASQAVSDIITVIIAGILFYKQLYKEFQ